MDYIDEEHQERVINALRQQQDNFYIICKLAMLGSLIGIAILTLLLSRGGSFSRRAACLLLLGQCLTVVSMTAPVRVAFVGLAGLALSITAFLLVTSWHGRAVALLTSTINLGFRYLRWSMLDDYRELLRLKGLKYNLKGV